LAEALDGLGMVALWSEGDVTSAQSFFEQSYELYQKHVDQRGIAMSMFHLAESTTLLQGHYAELEVQYMKSLAKFQELGDKFWVAILFTSLGELARLQGNYEQAGKFYEQNLEIFLELRGRFNLMYPFINLAWVSLHGGDYPKAHALLEESLRLSIESSNKPLTTGCLMGFASLLGMTGKPEKAVRLFGAAESLLDERLFPSDQQEFDHYLAVVRKQLEQATFAKAWAEGSAMTLEQAVAFAKENLKS
jgi:tetratricopeptide (TPR) repeat protein